MRGEGEENVRGEAEEENVTGNGENVRGEGEENVRGEGKKRKCER